MSQVEIIMICLGLIVIALFVATMIMYHASYKKLEQNIKHNSETLDSMSADIKELKIDQLRTHLMLLIADYPDNSSIPLLARTYVVDYKGNSFMIELIINWYNNSGRSIPEWLKSAYMQHSYQEEVK